MITVLCLTPCVDETIYLPTFVMGGTNRPRYKQSVAGGQRGKILDGSQITAQRADELLIFHIRIHAHVCHAVFL